MHESFLFFHTKRHEYFILRFFPISAMAYGRYEKGEREPSYQTVCFIAQTFHCNVDFLYGISDEMHTDYITISSAESPELYSLILELKKNHDMEKRILAYAKALSNVK